MMYSQAELENALNILRHSHELELRNKDDILDSLTAYNRTIEQNLNDALLVQRTQKSEIEVQLERVRQLERVVGDQETQIERQRAQFNLSQTRANLLEEKNQELTTKLRTYTQENEELRRTVVNLRHDIGLAEQIIGEKEDGVPSRPKVVIDDHGNIHIYI